MNQIIVYNPVHFLMKPFNWHGYVTEFIIKYADYVFVLNPFKARMIRERLIELNPNRKIKVICSLALVNNKENLLIGFGINRRAIPELRLFKGIKFFHLLDYYIDVQLIQSFLKNVKVDYVIGHCQMDEECAFFRKYYPEYIGKVIDLPFGYAKRFKCILPFEKRIQKAVGLGSINKMKDALLSERQTRKMVEFFPGREYQHEVRKFLQDKHELFSDCIDALFPSPEKQKDFGYDAVEMLNNYQMFVNDAGFSNFPPARTYEGIACGCVMVAPINKIYTKLGFQSGKNYIGYQENNYSDMINKIRFYINHQDELKIIQENSILLAKNYTHEKMADKLYQAICGISDKVK